MNIQFDFDLNQQDISDISLILGCEEAQLPDVLRSYALPALLEYLAMARGQKAFKRGSDILEYRLFLLIENAFSGRVPDEQTVSKIFQTTATESRGLIRSVISKYQYLLRGAIDETLKDVLANASPESAAGPYCVTMNSVNVIEELNKKLANIDGTLSSIAKKRGSVSTYEISKSSYDELCGALGIAPVAYQP